MRPAFVVSVVLTIVALFVIGLVKGRLAAMSLWRSALEVVAIGAASAAGGYLLGSLIPATCIGTSRCASALAADSCYRGSETHPPVD